MNYSAIRSSCLTENRADLVGFRVWRSLWHDVEPLGGLSLGHEFVVVTVQYLRAIPGLERCLGGILGQS